MKKLLFILLSLLLVMNASAIVTYIEWDDQTLIKTIDVGDSVNFLADAFTMSPPMTYSVYLIEQDTTESLYDFYEGTTTTNSKFFNHSFGEETYLSVGTYYVILSAEDSLNDGSQSFITLTVQEEEQEDNETNNAPVADFTFNPVSPKIYEVISFTSASSDPDGDSLSFSWDFNSDGFVDSTEESATYYYTTPGNKFVTLTVQDPNGETDSVTKTVPVSADLNITGISCFETVIQNHSQFCSVDVVSEGFPAESNVEFYFSDNSLFGTCTTDSISGSCGVNINMNELGTFSVHAEASEEGYASTISDSFSFEVIPETYDIIDLKIYNDADFSIEDYEFYRGETLYVDFDVQDMSGNSVSGLVSSAYLVSPLAGGNIELNSIGNYEYSVTIPLTHEFFGESQVFTFVFNFTDDTGGQEEVSLTILNNPPIIEEISVINMTYGETINLELEASDLEDNEFNWEVLEVDVSKLLVSLDNNLLTMTSVDAGVTEFKVRVFDLDNDFDETIVSVNISEQVFEYPIAIAGDDINVLVNEVFVLNGSQSYALGNATLDNFVWSIEGDVVEGSFINYSFTQAGNYTATLTITDSNNLSSSDSLTITVVEEEIEEPEEQEEEEQVSFRSAKNDFKISKFSLSTAGNAQQGNVIDVVAGDLLTTRLRFENTADTKMEDISISFSIPDLGLRHRSGTFDVKPGRSKSETVSIHIPNGKKGNYYGKLTVKGKNIYRNKYLLLRIR